MKVQLGNCTCLFSTHLNKNTRIEKEVRDRAGEGSRVVAR
jgi:hypothetical protein